MPGIIIHKRKLKFGLKYRLFELLITILLKDIRKQNLKNKVSTTIKN